ncbi:esterase FE4-like [Bombyx mandarina]|uniref:Esterase FE4-like n=1 Tax=Bombyx mandarina TaxID=7092 RepID=A0A6J2JU91_BOMMA|nr:esterase FE4-like [Bombyx mandarina]
MTISSKKKLKYVAIFAIITGAIAGAVIYYVVTFESFPQVKTKLGTIVGLYSSDGNYNMYMGVPYAMVNKSNPFGDSQPYPKFIDSLKADNDSRMCPQVDQYNNTIIGTLDCLNLNIYVPISDKISKEVKLPVLVFIHDSWYDFGSSGRHVYGPKYLMKHEIILVTINFRLGPYGFLCVDTPEVSGNQGLKDQILALRWVKENIDAFGGDPEKVTLAGIGTGGENVLMHVLYGNKDLFSKVIIDSGLTLPTLVMAETDSTIPFRLAQDLGFIAYDVKEAINFLATQDSRRVIRSSYKYDFRYKPCIENNATGVNTFATKHMSQINRIRDINKIKFMIGQTNNERLYKYSDTVFDSSEYRNIFEDELYDLFNFEADKLMRMEKYVRHFYIGNEDITDEVKPNLIHFFNDLYHNHPTKRTINKFIESGANIIYYSIFSYVGERNYMRNFYSINDTYPNATRADQIGYLFDVSYMNNNVTENDRLVIDRMTTLWANFVKYGNPTPDISDILPVKWESVTNKSLAYYDINKNVTSEVRPYHDRMAFWDLFYKSNGILQRSIRVK